MKSSDLSAPAHLPPVATQIDPYTSIPTLLIMATHNSDVPPGIVLVVLGLLALVLLWCIFKLTKLFTWIVYRILTQPGFWVIVSLFLLAEPNTRVHGVMIVLFVIFLRCQSSSDAINNHNDGYHYYTDPVGSSHQFTSMASNVQRHSAAPWTERGNQCGLYTGVIVEVLITSRKSFQIFILHNQFDWIGTTNILVAPTQPCD